MENFARTPNKQASLFQGLHLFITPTLGLLFLVAFLRVLSDSDSVKHFFFFYPRYAAQSNVHLTSAASILIETWPLSNNARNINF